MERELILSPGLVIADRFRLVRKLGEGGMGSVWLADHIRLQIPCAVKFMHAEVAAEPAYRARFDREAVAAAQIRSPHVVQILDHGTWAGTPYIAMEYLEGEDLAARLERGKLPPDETAAIVTQIARALTKAHAAGLVHRDLKPPNVFLVRDDDREIVKVLDFGVAKSSAPATSGRTQTGAIMGTPAYMSPEQAQGTKTVDHRTDLWALGVVAFECLTGALPFESDAFGDLVLKIIVEPIPVPSQVADDVPPGFDAWFARAVDRDPAARFQTAKELADALRDAIGALSRKGVGSPLTVASAPRATREAPDARVTPPGTPTRTSASPAPADPPGVMPAASAMEPAASSVGAPAPKRPRALVAAAVALLALLGVGAFVATRGHAAPPSAQAALALRPPPPPAAIPEAAAPALVPASAAPPVVAPEAAPPVVAPAAASASGAPPAPAAKARPGGARAPGNPASTSHDIGF